MCHLRSGSRMVNVTSVDENTHYQAENTLILPASRCVLLRDIISDLIVM